MLFYSSYPSPIKIITFSNPILKTDFKSTKQSPQFPSNTIWSKAEVLSGACTERREFTLSVIEGKDLNCELAALGNPI